MRTTIRIDDAILREARRIAADSGRTLAQVIEELLRESLHRRKGRRPSRAVRLPTFRGRGVRPGLDLDDSAGLLDVMESADEAP